MTVTSFLEHNFSSLIRHIMFDKISDDCGDKNVMLVSCYYNYFNTLYSRVYGITFVVFALI